jgi:flagellar biogenesis protein FliO
MRLMTVAIGTFLVLLQAADVLASDSQVAAAVVEKLPSADTVKIIVSPVTDDYAYNKVCLPDSVRIRLDNVGLSSGQKVKHLEVPRNSAFRSVKIVSQPGNKSVVQVFPRRSIHEVCPATSVMSIGGNLVVSTAADNKNAVLTKADSTPMEEDAASEPEVAAAPEAKDKVEEEKVAASEGAVEETEQSKEDRLKGTIFDKSTNNDTALSNVDGESINMKYAGVLLFAAFVGFAAWYVKKKKIRVGDTPDNIDILSTRKLGNHQQLMVAKVNGSRFLLAVGEKSVSALGMIPEDETPADAFSQMVAAPPVIPQREDTRPLTVAANRNRKVRTHATPYAEIKSETPAPAPVVEDDGFGSDFMAAIERISQQNNEAEMEMPRQKAAGDMDFGSDAPVSSNVEGLLSMAHMRAGHRRKNNRPEMRL